jgi:hypothetical protein
MFYKGFIVSISLRGGDGALVSPESVGAGVLAKTAGQID